LTFQHDDLWNFDEIGFQLGRGGDQWILTRNPAYTSYIATDTNRESVTCIEAVNASGDSIPPAVILPGVQIFESWVDNNLDGDTLLAVSATGYTDDLIGLRWLHHFDQLTKKRQKGLHRLLLMDGHGSHVTYEFIDYCDQNQIIPFCLPPHSTHLLQPLDLVVFSPYKHWHKEAVDAATRSGCTKFTKVEFLAALQGIRNSTFKSNTIKSAWRAAGIHPWNPKDVIDQIRPSTPTATEIDFDDIGHHHTTSSPIPPTTPRTVRSLRKVGRFLIRQTEPVSPTLMSRFVAGSISAAHAGAQAQADLMAATSAERARKARKAKKRILGSGGVMEASQCRLMAKEKAEQYEREEARKVHNKRKKEIQGHLIDGWKELLKDYRRVAKQWREGFDQDAAQGTLFDAGHFIPEEGIQLRRRRQHRPV
jgi:hypothetical protein